MERISYAADIEEAAGGPVLAAVIGQEEWRWEDDYRRIPDQHVGVVVDWSTIREWLDYPYDDGFGGVDCHPLWAWTADRVVYIHEYDGSTELRWAPRNPTAGAPHVAVA